MISETTRNIDSIAHQINEGRYADKELMMKLINRMLAFLNEFVKPKEQVQDGNGIGGDREEAKNVAEHNASAED
jgi:hypothetical protein